ncbi:MAG TPA: tRNA (adenosine(37)-N6)-threonylcarbamoyltransferase complex dimerization subunit type 1 TsaB [Clostridiales bacterium]|nr:tRNA (adenosine(37)-N6)-threonylcarbamoyltransferase complex dimerization subunit type 1 TsaB [Clostridiales bacterium]
MLILACDTSGPVVSAALWREGGLLAETSQRTARPHSVTLMPLIQDLLQDCALQIGDVDAYACSIGPGSFTGIRIGVSAVKAMAYAAGRPAIGVSSLEAIAWPYAACQDLLTCPMIDARNSRVYAAAWMGGRQLIPEANWLAGDFFAAIASLDDCQAAGQPVGEAGRGIIAVGFYPEIIKSDRVSALNQPVWQAPASLSWPRAAAIAEIAALRLAAGDAGAPQQLEPRYLARTQAERCQTGTAQTQTQTQTQTQAGRHD